jgi:DNA-binding CsgD family transcriptional regulator
MGVNESTIRKHLENAYRKLGVNSREQMVKALDESLLPKNRIQVFGVYL